MPHSIGLRSLELFGCPASWFESNATPAQVKTIRRFSMDRLAMLDDFEVGGAW